MIVHYESSATFLQLEFVARSLRLRAMDEADDLELERPLSAPSTADDTPTSTNPWSVENREFVLARQNLVELSELADLEKVSVLTYNVLSQTGARKLQKECGYVDAAILSITRRREHLLREILSYDADIMCLQEIDDYEDWWCAQLNAAGYDSVFAERPGDERDDGLVTAFKKDTFQIFSSKHVNLNDLRNEINDLNLQAKAWQNNNALLVAVQPWEQSQLPSAICVVNTQLASEPSLDNVRVLQTEFLCREIAKFNCSFQLPILFAGTFNSLPSSDVYHVVHTGRRRPVPEAPHTPNRPVVDDPSASSLRIRWTKPETTPDAPILAYKISMKNCSTPTVGFVYETELLGVHEVFVMAMLSSGITYQFRIAAKNKYGWSHFSQPSRPQSTLEADKLRGDDHTTAEAKQLFILDDIPPAVKPYNASHGSGWTPRFEDKSSNDSVCPRALYIPSQAEQKQYWTLEPRADRDDRLVHHEQFESAYAIHQQYLCEPEFTYSGEKFAGTVDYIFHTSRHFAPFQLLRLPSLNDIVDLGDDERQPALVLDTELARHRPRTWASSLSSAADEKRYMGKWDALEIPNRFQKQNPWLPNAMFPSDHLAMVCVFAVRKDTLAVGWN